MNPLRTSGRLLTAVCLLSVAPAYAQLRFTPDPGMGLSTASPAVAARTDPVLVDRVVAIVNQEVITARELESRTRSILARLKGQNVRLPSADELQRQVLERMIIDRAAVQAAREAGIRIDDAVIDRAVTRIAADQKLSVAQLRQRIEGEGLSFATFRQEIASEIAISRLREREIESRIQVSEAEIDNFLTEQSQGAGAPTEYDIAQILVRLPEGAAPELVERLRLRAEGIAREARSGVDFGRLAANLSDGTDAIIGGSLGFRTADRLPPLFVQAVEPLAPGEVAPVVRSPAGFHILKLNNRKQGGPSKALGGPVKQTRVRHILVRIDEINPEPAVVRRLTEIRERLEAGTVTFADMARQYSKDGSASSGGDIGWVYAGDTVPEFERAMDELQPGQIGGPVRTPFGYHLIQVVERRTDEASPERVRAAARAALRERKSAEAYQEWLTQLRARAYVDLRLDEL